MATTNEKIVTLALLALNNELATKYVDDADAALKTLIDAVSAKLAVLEGEDEGSVKKIVADALAEIVADAPESLDTLKEISDWIASHGSDAAEMNTAIQENASDISELKEKVESLESEEPLVFATAEDIRALWAEKNSDEEEDTENPGE